MCIARMKHCTVGTCNSQAAPCRMGNDITLDSDQKQRTEVLYLNKRSDCSMPYIFQLTIL